MKAWTSLASMGPWLLSHGRVRLPATESSIRPLQWGRGFSATEGIRTVAGEVLDFQLQWGRGFSATEGTKADLSMYPRRKASMGPWLLSHGRDLPPRGGNTGEEASMGPWLLSHGRGLRSG